jgi:dTDP-4-dehydrorhamnose 3,5-epimerase
VFYQVTQYYTPGSERGVRWDDPAFGIDWPEAACRVVSPKDRSWPAFCPGPSTA